MCLSVTAFCVDLAISHRDSVCVFSLCLVHVTHTSRVLLSYCTIHVQIYNHSNSVLVVVPGVHSLLNNYISGVDLYTVMTTSITVGGQRVGVHYPSGPSTHFWDHV